MPTITIQTMHKLWKSRFYKWRPLTKDGTLFPYSPPASTPAEELPDEGEIITVLAKQMGRVLLVHDHSYITKSGRCVRPPEAEAMRMVPKYSPVPVPEVIFALVKGGHGTIGMTIIPGSPFERHWGTLDDTTKRLLCCQIWDLIAKLQQILQKQELEHLIACTADGSPTKDSLLADILQSPGPLETDSAL